MARRVEHSLGELFSEIQEMKEEHSKTQRLAEEERQAREATARETHELHSQILLHEADIRDVFKGNANLEQELAECRAHHSFLIETRDQLQARRSELLEERERLEQDLDARRATFKQM